MAKFENRSAKVFGQNDLKKIEKMSEEEIFNILKKDIDVIIKQMVAHRQHQRGAKYPSYITNAFANISTARFMLWFVDSKRKELTEEEIDAVRVILMDAYRASTTRKLFSNQMLEYMDRNDMLREAFHTISKKPYKLTKQLKLNKVDADSAKALREELIIQLFCDPMVATRQVARIMNKSNIHDKKKIKFLKMMYGEDNFITMCGRTLCIESANSDFVPMIFTYMATAKKKERKRILRAYATAFKEFKTSCQLLRNEEFYEDNKKIMKKLWKTEDLGFKKAFSHIKPKKNKNAKPTIAKM